MELSEAEFRAQNINARERKAIDQIADRGDHTIRVEGELNKTWLSLEDKGWIKVRDNGWTGADCLNTIQFTLDGWDALCILYPDEE